MGHAMEALGLPLQPVLALLVGVPAAALVQQHVSQLSMAALHSLVAASLVTAAVSGMAARPRLAIALTVLATVALTSSLEGGDWKTREAGVAAAAALTVAGATWSSLRQPAHAPLVPWSPPRLPALPITAAAAAACALLPLSGLPYVAGALPLADLPRTSWVPPEVADDGGDEDLSVAVLRAPPVAAAAAAAARPLMLSLVRRPDTGGAMQQVVNATGGKVLLVWDVDGRLTALRADSGERLWQLDTGRPFARTTMRRVGERVRATGGAPAPASDANDGLAECAATSDGVDGMSPAGKATSTALMRMAAAVSDGGACAVEGVTWPHVIIPGREGSIYIRNAAGGLQRLPLRADELAREMPLTRGAFSIMSGTTTRTLEVSLATGAVARMTAQTATGFEVQVDHLAEGARTPLSPAAAAVRVRFTFTDYSVSYVEAATGTALWNMTYSVIAPGAALVYGPADAMLAAVAEGREGSGRGKAPGAGAGSRGRGGVRAPGYAFVFQNETVTSSAMPPTTSAATSPALHLLRLVATTKGDIYAMFGANGSMLWQGLPLGVPINKVLVAQVVEGGGGPVSEVPFTELWPAPALPAVPTQNPATRHPASTGHQVYVEALADGNLVALQHGEGTVLTTVEEPTCAAAVSANQLLRPGMEAEPLRFLPAPQVGAIVPASTALVTTEGDVAEGLHKLTLLPMQFMGLQNVCMEVKGQDTASTHDLPPAHGRHSAEVQAMLVLALWLLEHLFGSLPTGVLAFAFLLGLVAMAIVGLRALLRDPPAVRGPTHEPRPRRRRRSAAEAEAEAGSDATPVDAAAGAATSALPSAPAAVVGHAAPQTVEVRGVPHRVVGRLLVSDRSLCAWSPHTSVYAGMLGDRPVAVKCMLRRPNSEADREKKLLSLADKCANVVRYFGHEQAGDVVYLIMELCDRSLAEAMDDAAKRRASASDRLWHAGVPVPPPATRNFLRELVSGVAYVHGVNIVHRDLKPHNILLVKRDRGAALTSGASRVYPDKEHHTIGDFVPKLADFGLGKQLADGSSAYYGAAPSLGSAWDRRQGRGGGAGDGGAGAYSLVAPGTVGWQAPEVLRASGRAGGHAAAAAAAAVAASAAAGELPPTSPSGGSAVSSEDGSGGGAAVGTSTLERLSRAADVWSLACVLYSVLDAGGHPYGNPIERDLRISENKKDLSRLESVPEAAALLASMLDEEPLRRPTAERALEHPFFWDDDKRVHFLSGVSNFLASSAEPRLVEQFEAEAGLVVGACWAARLPKRLQPTSDHRAYRTDKVVDLLRYLRNKASHFNELDINVRANVIGGSEPADLAPYFLAPSRFPYLLLAVYRTVVCYLAHEEPLRKFLGGCTVKQEEAASLRARERLRTTGVPATLPPLAAFAPRPLVLASPPGVSPLPPALPPAAPPAGAAPPLATSVPPPVVAATTAEPALVASASLGVAPPPLPPPLASPPPSMEASPLLAIASPAPLGASPPPWVPPSDPVAPPPPPPPVPGRRPAAAAPAVPPGGDAPTPLGARGWLAREGGWVSARCPANGVLVPQTLERGDAAPAGPKMVQVVAAHASLGETAYRGGAHADVRQYKSALCKDWDGIKCGRGVRCDFAHGLLELRTPQAVHLALAHTGVRPDGVVGLEFV